MVSLAKDTRVRVGKEINPSILEFQRSHFYGKGTKRVDSGSFMKHKLSVQSHKKCIVCFLRILGKRKMEQ